MKKTIIMAFAAIMALTACQHYQLGEDETIKDGDVSKREKIFTFHVRGEFTTGYEDMGTRASVLLDGQNTAGITDLWVLDYQDGILMQQVHQVSTDAGFGAPKMALTYGHHDIKLVAAKGSEPLLTASALTWGRVKDTFVLDYPVDVVASSNGNRAPELKRAVGGVKLVMTDAVPANAQEIELTMLRSQTLMLPSLAASAVAASSVINEFPTSWVGSTNVTMTVYTLCPSDEMVTDIAVVILDNAGNSISEFTIDGVEIRKNRITTLSGEVFSRGNGFSVSIDDSWDAPLDVEF